MTVLNRDREIGAVVGPAASEDRNVTILVRFCQIYGFPSIRESDTVRRVGATLKPHVLLRKPAGHRVADPDTACPFAQQPKHPNRIEILRLVQLRI